MTCKVPIGRQYIVRHSMFSARDSAGAYQHTMPPMTRDAEHLQAALLVDPTRKTRAARTYAVCAVAIAALLLIAMVPL